MKHASGYSGASKAGWWWWWFDDDDDDDNVDDDVDVDVVDDDDGVDDNDNDDVDDNVDDDDDDDDDDVDDNVDDVDDYDDDDDDNVDDDNVDDDDYDYFHTSISSLCLVTESISALITPWDWIFFSCLYIQSLTGLALSFHSIRSFVLSSKSFFSTWDNLRKINRRENITKYWKCNSYQ